MTSLRRFVVRLPMHLVLLAGCWLAGCTGGANVQPVRAQQPVDTPSAVDHSAYTDLLQTYVDDAGMVDYGALKAAHDEALAPYLQMLAETDPSNLDDSERLAFWINAYNALTLKLIIDHYPVESIRDITPAGGPAVPKLNDPWHVKVGEVGGQIRTLDEIEHDPPLAHLQLVRRRLRRRHGCCPALPGAVLRRGSAREAAGCGLRGRLSRL